MNISDTAGRQVKTVRVVRPSSTKVPSWFANNQGKVFTVIQQRAGGFDIDLAPCGYPGTWGYVSDKEVEIVDYH